MSDYVQLIDYSKSCPFKPGDRVQLRSDLNLAFEAGRGQDFYLDQYGTQSFVITGLDGEFVCGSPTNNGLNWRRFEYALEEKEMKSDPTSPISPGDHVELTADARNLISRWPLRDLDKLWLQQHNKFRVTCLDGCGNAYLNGLDNFAINTSRYLRRIEQPVAPSQSSSREQLPRYDVNDKTMFWIRCGACFKQEASGGFEGHFEGGGFFAFPIANTGEKGDAWLREGIHLCPGCAKSVAEHVQFLKINHGPTRTGRT